jgi:hypothetical protein
MRLPISLLLVLGILSFAGSVNAEELLSEKNGSLVRRVSYEGKGWRNTRQLETTITIERPGELPFTASEKTVHFACGSREAFTPTVMSEVRDTRTARYEGVSQGQSMLDVGFVSDIGPDLYLGAAKIVASVWPQFLARLTRICASPPTTVSAPLNLAVASNRGNPFDVSVLLTDRFRRTGSTIRYWLEVRPVEKVSITYSPIEPEDETDRPITYEIEIPRRSGGKTLMQFESNCASSSVRTLTLVSYSGQGTVVSSRDYDLDLSKNPLRETVPQSIGEVQVKAACLIQ